ncbi:transcriptional regulator [Devosia geojensis]|uniref:Transcriptional regulator n=1 Tax=Devosia geojensis TaxID=443610 RepID=A0A0F5FYJ8_9HYPH|nr:LytTR family DNA-binding domain-containing protein [Devosia geojensis]KKB13257.1 transcriptional regulator [Devosia geojensis]
MIRCVVAEDEELLRRALIEALAEAWPELTVVAEAEDGGAAIEAIAREKPDVAFLDIRMPGLTGLDVAAASIDISPATQVVFVTAYDQYAIDAFEKGAVDYLLKPVNRERLRATVERLKSRIGGQADAEALSRLSRLLGTLQAGAAPLTWITASAGSETRLLMVEDVAYFRADNKYTVAMTAEGEMLLRKPLRELIAELDPNLFKQVHRSTIVNLKAVASVSRDETGKGILKLKTRPERLSVSQPYMTLFRAM